MTISDTSIQAQDFSYSNPMVVSVRCDATLELGKMLIEELDLDQSVDTLQRWMIHYIAELIQEAENAGVEEKPRKMKVCSDAVLSLWKHRHVLPNGSRPFEDLEPIFRALESLDPDSDSPRYYRNVRSSIDDSEQNSELSKWLEIIEGIDSSSKILICFFLSQASRDAINKTEKWVELASAIGLDADLEYSVVRLISKETMFVDGVELNKSDTNIVQQRISKLENFIRVAELMVSDMKQKIQQTSSDQGPV